MSIWRRSPIPTLVPVTAARALGLPDQPGRSTTDTLLRFIGDRQMLMVLDNCEHLLDAGAALIDCAAWAPARIDASWRPAANRSEWPAR